MSALRAMIAAESRQPVFAAAQTFAEHLHNIYGVSVAAIVFYGSCLRHDTDRGLLLDFYVLVDSMGTAIKNPISATLGTLLPPNVYYHEMNLEDRTVRAKVAVMSMSRFMRDTGSDCFASSTWARFAQPARILYVRHDGIRARVINALTQAVETMIVRTMPLLPVRFTARDLWVNALTATYGAELRPESTSKAAELVDAELGRYIAVTERVVGQATSDATYMNAMFDKQNATRRAWVVRRIQGKVLNVLRLIKAAFTFQGGLDYAVWKIERHSGVKIQLTDRDRKWPLLTGLRLLPIMLKRGGIK